MVTPVNIEELAKLLKLLKYPGDKSSFLVDGFTNGFDIGYEGPQVRQSVSENIPFQGVGNAAVLCDKLIKEVRLKRVAGPFNETPFENYMQSPIGSLNANTPKHKFSVKYNDLDVAVDNCLDLLAELNAVKLPSGHWSSPPIYFGKTDIQSAFRILGLKRGSWIWLIMKAKDPASGEWQFFVDKCLPFRASISCALFQAFCDALKHIFEYLEKIKKCTTNYLDDFLFLAAMRILCNYLVNKFLELCQRLNVPMSEEKTVWASVRVVFLGILLDGEHFLLVIPVEKKLWAIELLEKFSGKRKAIVGDLQALCGFLNFLTKAIFAGRTFTR